MTVTMTDLYPVARDGPHEWLLLPKDEAVRQAGTDMTQMFYKYDALSNTLYQDGHPLQVWCKFLYDPVYVKPMDTEYFDSVVRKKAEEAPHDQQPLSH
jgi:hypothetical protein